MIFYTLAQPSAYCWAKVVFSQLLHYFPNFLLSAPTWSCFSFMHSAASCWSMSIVPAFFVIRQSLFYSGGLGRPDDSIERIAANET